MKDYEESDDVTRKIYTIQPWRTEVPEEVKCVFASYRNNGALAMQLLCRPDHHSGEGFCVPFGVATVNLPESQLLPYNVQFIDDNNIPGLGTWLESNGIAFPTGASSPSGYCMYEAYEFMLPLEEWRKVVHARNYGCDWKPSFMVTHHNVYNGEKMECDTSRKKGEAFLKTCLREIVLSPTLDHLFELHKEMWHRGVRCPETEADRFGMFRTGSIASMSKDEVVIQVPGVGSGLLSRWIGTDKEQEALQVYKDHLTFGVSDLLVEVNDNGIDRRAVKDFIEMTYQGFSDIEFQTDSLSCFTHIPFTYRENGMLKESSVIFCPEEKDILALVPTSWPRVALKDIPVAESVWKSLKDPERRFTLTTDPMTRTTSLTEHARKKQQPQKNAGVHM